MEILNSLSGYAPLLIISLILFFSSARIIPEHERAVAFRLGKFVGVKGPGVIFIIPGFVQLIKVDLRVIEINLENISIKSNQGNNTKFNIVFNIQVKDPESAVIKIADYSEYAKRFIVEKIQEAAMNYSDEEIKRPKNHLLICEKVNRSSSSFLNDFGVELSNLKIR